MSTHEPRSRFKPTQLSVVPQSSKADHTVQFYEDDGFLCDAVAAFLAAGLFAGEPLVVIATSEHREAFARRLEAKSIDTERAQASGKLTMLDAEETLALFMVGDQPDWELFESAVGGILSATSVTHPHARIRAYGEMVDVLWRAGKSTAAVRLEEMWNELSNGRSFSLLCAYAMGSFCKGGDAGAFEQVCRAHTHVVPTECYTRIDDSEARLREVALLQQRARALECELEQRKELESALREALRERLQAEEALRQERAMLARSNQDLDQFAYVASHDLKAPLRAIANLSQWIEEDQGELMTPQTREQMNLLRGRVHRMEALIDGVLRYSRAGRNPHPLETVDVAKLLDDILESIQPPAGTKIDIAAGMPVFETELIPLYQVLQNLLGNALKFTRRSDAEISIRAIDEGPAYRFSVEDNGPGIAPQYQDRIWRAFTTLEARDVIEGTGIGLSLVKKIVEAQGGRAWVESAPGEGATFHFLWPKPA